MFNRKFKLYINIELALVDLTLRQQFSASINEFQCGVNGF